VCRGLWQAKEERGYRRLIENIDSSTDGGARDHASCYGVVATVSRLAASGFHVA
jgi:hypothetical protein